MSDNIRAVIDGGSESGKTTLAISLARQQWEKHSRRSIVFDPWREHDWGPWSWKTDDLDTFRRAVWGTKGFAIFWDESTQSLNKHAQEDRQFFTAIRHNHPAFFVLVHDYAVLSPVMRTSITDAYLFRKSARQAQGWAEALTDDDLLQVTELAQYEFIHKRAFRPITRQRPEIKNGFLTLK